MDTFDRKLQVGDRILLKRPDSDYPRIPVGTLGYIREFGGSWNETADNFAIAYVEYDDTFGHDVEGRGSLSAWTNDLEYVTPEPVVIVIPEAYGYF